MSHPGCTIIDMQSQLALVLEIEEPPAVLATGSAFKDNWTNNRADRWASNVRPGARSVVEPVRNAMHHRPGDFGVLSARTCSIGRKGIAAARAKLAALPAQPEIDLNAA